MLTIEFYGVLRQVMGGASVQLEDLSGEVTVAAALECLRQQYPAIAEYLPRVACAQGDRLIRRDQPIDPARPLVLLPPVSGG